MNLFLLKQRQYILFVLLLLCLATQSQTAQLKGTVTDSSSGEAIPAVIVMIPDLKQVTSCDAMGHYLLSPLPAGKYICKVSCIGYKTLFFKTDLKENETQ